MIDQKRLMTDQSYIIQGRLEDRLQDASNDQIALEEREDWKRD